MLKSGIVLFLVFLCFTKTNAQDQSGVKGPKYSRAKIFYKSPKGLLLLASHGLPVDHGSHKKGIFIESDFSENELNIARSLGMNVEVVIDDVKQFYVERNKSGSPKSQLKNASCLASSSGNGYVTPSNFALGSMGGFFTYNEFLSHIDAMAQQYPHLISAKQPISTSLNTAEGRPLYWLKISDNPNVDETEPEILYTAIHHSREPASLTQLIYYMWYVLENYDTDDEIKAIVDHTEMYFVPMINPDGYVYNVVNDPNGGGMWRKNRRNHGNGDYGVDPNRNYSYQWGTTGVSFNTSQDTYPGSAAFSEAENQLIKMFCEDHEFVMALNYHTYGNLLLYPYGHQNLLTPDNDTYVAISSLMVSENGFSNQLSSLLYPASGDSDDWMYTATPQKDKILALTPEIGNNSAGFWPAQNDIIGICESTLYQNITAAHLITNYAKINDLNPSNTEIASGHLKYDLQRLGLQDPANFTVSVEALEGLTITGSSNAHNNMTLLQTDEDSIAYALNFGLVAGDPIRYVWELDNGLYVYRDTIEKVYGTAQIAFADNGSGLTNWTSNSWDITSQEFHSPSSSITDSPSGEYSNSSSSEIQLNQTIDLTNAISANVSFWAFWEIEVGYDYVQFMVSTDGGNNWIPQCGKYTKAGNGNQDQGNPVYDGAQSSWVQEEISLSDYIGQTIQFRFMLKSDQYVSKDGFYFDDFEVNVLYGPASLEDEAAYQFNLMQNMPNPSTGETAIGYRLPVGVSNAQLVITNQVGQLIERFDLSATSNSININTDNYATGSYLYFIETNGVRSASQKMLVTGK